ncbi:MAG: hypothetical protein K0Q59_3087 [Paenibacillus sp.]|nr:hypothetical protein [Paenibacillus sp.]
MDYGIPIKVGNETIRYFLTDSDMDARGELIQSMDVNQLDSFVARLAESVVLKGQLYEHHHYADENGDKAIEVRPYRHYEDSINEAEVIDAIIAVLLTDISPAPVSPTEFGLDVYEIGEEGRLIYSLQANSSLDIITILLDHQRIIEGKEYPFLFSCLDWSKRKVYLFVSR